MRIWGLEVDVGAALNIVAYVVAVFLWREPGGHPFTSIDAQSVSLNTLRVFVFATARASMPAVTSRGRCSQAALQKEENNMSNFEIIQQQQHVHNPDIRKVLISLS